jgi:hypothetical protein
MPMTVVFMVVLRDPCNFHQAIVKRRRLPQVGEGLLATSLQFLPSRPIFFHQMECAITTPGRMRSVITAFT